MVDQLSGDETLVPPNFKTIHGDEAIASGAPSAALSSNPASFHSLVIAYPAVTKKKPARMIPAGLLAVSELY